MNLRRAPRTLASLFVTLVALGLSAEALAGPPSAEAARPNPTLPVQVPAPERVRFREIVEDPSVSTKVNGDAFTARREVFEYLLDHPEFASHVARMLRTARYRIWRNAEGLQLDDGWGTVGHFDVVHSAEGLRVMYARGQYKARMLPDISGQDIVRFLKQDYRTEKLPIVLFSSRSDEELARIAEAAGADGYLSKVHGLEKLGEMVDELVESILW